MKADNYNISTEEGTLTVLKHYIITVRFVRWAKLQ